ncbi:MAG: IS701 family transposase [Gammaproteobacteria bacterium]
MNARRFDEYIERLVAAVGHADRAEPLRAYCTGLLLPGERKSVEPMAARIAPGKVRQQHQSMHHFVAAAPWDDEAVLAVSREVGREALDRHGGVEGWVVDDTGWPKKGKYSVGVARQYCGQVGKKENSQVAVSLSLVNTQASVPIAFRLYLPQAWAEDEARRARVGVPPQVKFATQPALSLQQIEAALSAGVEKAPVLADAGYGNDTAYRERLTELGLRYAVGIHSTTTVWGPGRGPLPPKPGSGRGQKPTRLRRDEAHQPLTVRALALELPPSAYRIVRWREGTHTVLRSRFAAVRVVAAHEDGKRSQPRAAEWLLIEWPTGEAEPTKYFLSTLPPRTSLKRLVRTVKLRWRIERDYQELKQALGLNQYEGRGWRGFHHHATLTIAAYTFLVAERSRFSPSGVGTCPPLPAPALPEGFRPRGAPDPTRTPHPHLDCYAAHPVDPRPDPASTPLSLLPAAQCSATNPRDGDASAGTWAVNGMYFL